MTTPIPEGGSEATPRTPTFFGDPTDVSIDPSNLDTTLYRDGDENQPTFMPVPGTTLGKYLIQQRIGRGGMGIVLKALDPDLNRAVAIKVLGAHLAHSARARRRFQREARAAAAVTHPHVLTIHSVDEQQGLLFLVMEHAHCSLKDYIASKGKLSFVETVRLGTQIALGLAAAHEQGLIHRDVKPGNVMLDAAATRAQISDFGLARAVHDNSDISSHDQCVGTPAYMAPEMIKGDEVDLRSDLFGLGCVLYQMLAGFAPFQGRLQGEVIHKIVSTQPTPLHELDSSIPEPLARVVERLMAKAPQDRFQSAREVADILTFWQRELNQSPSHEFQDVFKQALPGNKQKESNRRSWIAVVSIALTSLLLVVGAKFFYFPSSTSAPRLLEIPATDTIGPQADSLWKKEKLLVGLGADADFSTIEAALPHIAPGGTIHVRSDEPLRQPILIKGAPLNGIKLIADPPVTLLSPSSLHPTSLTIADVHGVRVEGFRFLVTDPGCRAAQIIGSASGITLARCDFRHQIAPQNQLSLVLVQNSQEDLSALPVLIQECQFHAAKGGKGISISPTEGLTSVVCRWNRFHAVESHLYVTQGCARLRLENNLFIAGSIGVNLSLREWSPKHHIAIVNNTFFGQKHWLGLMNSFRDNSIPEGKTDSLVSNNLILGGERVQGGEDQWTIATNAWIFSGNWFERDRSTRRPTELDLRIAKFVDKVELINRDDPQNGDYLRPVPGSPLIVSGSGDQRSNYTGRDFTSIPQLDAPAHEPSPKPP